jgi:ParB family chromosome partitioning protein
VPTAENYLGRVTKARILEAVREAKGEQAAQRIEGLKKDAMAEAAAQALAGTGWLPEPLRTKGVVTCVTHEDDTEQKAASVVQAEPVADDEDAGERQANPAALDGAALAAE